MSVKTLKQSSKTRLLSEQLTDMALGLGANAKLPTVLQLKRELNVSLTTLDSVLTQLESQNVIYRKHGVGIFVSPRLSQNCVGLVCEPTFFRAGGSPFWQQLMEAAQQRASASGEAFRFYLAMPSSDGQTPVHDDLVEDVQARRIQGVLFVGNNDAAQNWLQSHDTPSVVFAGRGEYTVRIDAEQMVKMAAGELHRRGAREMALMVPWEVQTEPAEEPFYSPDARGFLDFMTGYGLPLRNELVWETRAMSSRVPYIPETHQEQGYQAVITLFEEGFRPDGIISADDMMTRGILAALRKLGLQVGRDVQLASHVNKGSTVLHGEEADIVLVEVDPAEIVQRMFAQLEKLMSGTMPEEDHVYVRARLQQGI